VSWGKIDPENLPDCVVCYADATITLPIITAYALARSRPRRVKRLYDQRDQHYDALRAQYFKHGKVEKIAHRTDVTKPKRGRSGRSVVGSKRNGT
jgi:deoxyhypusine synthase